jgi:NTP pyrophosphatase (non-canonical NTP hydrolase)
MHNALTVIYNIHTKRIARDIHILSFQRNSFLSFRRMASMIEKIGEPAMLEQLAEESVELAKACLKLARKLRGENPTPKSKAECQRELLEEFTDVIQCSRELKLQPDEEQIEEKRLRFLTRWTAATQSKIDSKKRHTH